MECVILLIYFRKLNHQKYKYHKDTNNFIIIVTRKKKSTIRHLISIMKQNCWRFCWATKILPYLQDSLNLFGWFTYDMNRQEVITRQDGIFRVNCLDCLDRTNLIEQVICRSVLENILTNQGIYNNRMAFEGMIQKHNTLWADNGDAISQIYTGTNALKSSFSRSGKMNFAGALSDVTKSVSRMYQNTFVDGKNN